MNIVIEGIPGAGKTSLVNYSRTLKSDFQFIDEFVLCNGNTIPTEEDCIKNDFMKEKMSLELKNTIQDRSKFSTIGYIIARDQKNLDWDTIRAIELMLYGRLLVDPEYLFILEISPEKSIENQLRRENYFCPSNFFNVDFLQRWNDFYNFLSWPSVEHKIIIKKCNYGKLEDIKREFKEFLNE